MHVFDNYSVYYNLLYKDKDYLEESTYIDGMIRKFKPEAKTVLDLGCGTGKHDFILAEKKYSVTGVDQSASMLSVAQEQLAKHYSELTDAVAFHQQDIRTLRLRKSFDVVISLFHVLSYQPTNDDLRRSFETVAEHLKPGGIFIFDCWYGPGVLDDPPVSRKKIIENDLISVTRFAKPLIHRHQNRVDIFYYVLVRNKKSNHVKEIRECHRMRYLFKPEIELLMDYYGLKVLSFTEFLKETPPGTGKWNACFVGQKIA